MKNLNNLAKIDRANLQLISHDFLSYMKQELPAAIEDCVFKNYEAFKLHAGLHQTRLSVSSFFSRKSIYEITTQPLLDEIKQASSLVTLLNTVKQFFDTNHFACETIKITLGTLFVDKNDIGNSTTRALRDTVYQRVTAELLELSKSKTDEEICDALMEKYPVFAANVQTALFAQLSAKPEKHQSSKHSINANFKADPEDHRRGLFDDVTDEDSDHENDNCVIR